MSEPKDLYTNSSDAENSYDLYSVASGVPRTGYAVKKAKRIRRTINTIASIVLAISVLLTGVMGVFLYISGKSLGGLEADDNPQDGYEQLYTSESSDVTYMLVAGVDLGERLTDIMVVVCFDHKNDTISCLQIPRDTFVDYELKTYRTNSIYGQTRKGESGINALRRKLSTHFGIPIDHYVIFTIDGFMNVVDAVGGVQINITQKEGIEIENQHNIGEMYTIGPGWVTLDGNAAAGFVRKRKGGESGYSKGDISRLEAQRLMYVALVKKLKEMGFGQLGSVAKSCYNEIATDLTVNQIIGYAREAKAVDFSNFTVFTVPGQGCTYKGYSLYSIHKQAYVDMFNEHFNPYGEELFAEDIKVVELHTDLGKKTTTSLASEGGSLQQIMDDKNQ